MKRKAGANLRPVVLLVDDDPVVLQRVRKEVLRNTQLGVLIAETLPAAIALLDQNFPVGAVLADLYFRSETHDRDRNIRDGLDLLGLIRDQHPDIPGYVFSVAADDRSHRAKAMQMGLRVRDWLDKLSSDQPWVQIERELIVDALKADSTFREMVR